MKLKKILAATLAALTAISFASCGGDSDSGGGGGKGGNDDGTKSIKNAKIEGVEEYDSAEDLIDDYIRLVDEQFKDRLENFSLKDKWDDEWDKDFTEFYYEENALDEDEKLDGDPVTITLTMKRTFEEETQTAEYHLYFLKDGKVLSPAGYATKQNEDDFTFELGDGGVHTLLATIDDLEDYGAREEEAAPVNEEDLPVAENSELKNDNYDNDDYDSYSEYPDTHIIGFMRDGSFDAALRDCISSNDEMNIGYFWSDSWYEEFYEAYADDLSYEYDRTVYADDIDDILEENGREPVACEICMESEDSEGTIYLDICFGYSASQNTFEICGSRLYSYSGVIEEEYMDAEETGEIVASIFDGDFPN